MKTKKRFLSLLLSLALVLGLMPGMSLTASADGTAGSSWTENSDGTLSLSDTAANKAAGTLTKGNMILIGTKGGTISNLPSGTGIVTKASSSNNAAMIRYTSAVNKDTIVAAIQSVKFSSSTTQVHIDVTVGSTTDSMSGTTNFGVLNADGEAHVYKLIKHDGSSISWIDAFSNIGGLKGYLATVTTADEAMMVRDFYNSNDSGTWIGGTSLHYSTDRSTTYENAGKVTPSNYSAGGSSVSSQKIIATSGTYYCPFDSSSVSASLYYSYYYWACGPEQGQEISKSLWASGEPNNSDSNRGGETCIVSPWGGKAEFNDFSPFNAVSDYFVEFSAYSDGLADGAAYNSITVYKVTFDGNGATGSIASMEKFKGEAVTLPTDYTGFTLPSGTSGFAGWFDAADGSNENPVTMYAEDAPKTFYAHWLKKPIAAEVTANNRTYDGSEKPLVTVDDSTLVGGTMQYALGMDATTAPTAGWGASIPTATDAGTYYVWYKVVGDTDHIDSNAECVPVEILELVSLTVTYKVINGTWSDGSTTDITETVQSGLKPASVPTGMKASEGYTGGAWNMNPADATITEATTFTYTFEAVPTYTVTYKVVNGTWSDGTMADISETVASGENPIKVPAGMKAAEGYTGGAWNADPAAATITEATTFTYTFDAESAAVVKEAPKAKDDLTYTGSPQELVTGGTAEGGTMQYAIGTSATTPPTEGWSTAIPTGTEAGTYYVWYYVKGDSNHTDSEPVCIMVKIAGAAYTVTATPKPVPKTGDGSNPALWLGLAVAGLILIAGTVILWNRKKRCGK